MMNRTQGPCGILPKQNGPSLPSSANTGAAAPKASFGQILDQVRSESNPSQPSEAGINFSKHAISRAEERGIELTPELLKTLAGSVEKAQEKGAKNILAFNATQAFIINVPYGRVITTMNQDEMKENIFTNIDGAVLI